MVPRVNVHHLVPAECHLVWFQSLLLQGPLQCLLLYVYCLCVRRGVCRVDFQKWHCCDKGMCIYSFGRFCQLSFLVLKPSFSLPARSESTSLSPNLFLSSSTKYFLAFLCLFSGISAKCNHSQETMCYTCVGVGQMRNC